MRYVNCVPGVRAGEGEEEEEDVSHLNEGVTLKYSENVEDLLAYLKSHPMFMTKEPTVEDIDNNPLLQVGGSVKSAVPADRPN